MAENKAYRLEVQSEYPEWWRYNVFVTAACFDSGGNVSDYLTLTDKVYEPGDGDETRQAPGNYDAARPLAVEIPPCDHADVYVYVIANTFPASVAIRESPPFEIRLVVSSPGAKPETVVRKVNQWGGVSITHRIRQG